MYYSGHFLPTHPEKYKGSTKEIVYRSSWELASFIWLDTTPGVIEWSSESVIVPYTLNPQLVESVLGNSLKTDDKIHRYFVDLTIKFANGTTYLVEVKPYKQTLPPAHRTRKTKKYLRELLTYIQNMSKWEAAREWASQNNMKFMVFTENELRRLGVKLASGWDLKHK